MKMGSGMTVFLVDKVGSMKQWDEVSATCFSQSHIINVAM